MNEDMSTGTAWEPMRTSGSINLRPAGAGIAWTGAGYGRPDGKSRKDRRPAWPNEDRHHSVMVRISRSSS